MTNNIIDNSADEKFGKTILWQYDKAENLIALIKSFLGIHDSATKDLWDEMQKELDVDTASEFGLSILGSLLGVPRDQSSYITLEMYRRWIKAWAVLVRTDFAFPDVYEFFKSVTINEMNRFASIRDASVIDRFVMSLGSVQVQETKDVDTGVSIYEETSLTIDDENASQDDYQDELYADGNTIHSPLRVFSTVKSAENANGLPAGVRLNKTLDSVIFGFDGQQYKSSGDYQIGGFDDSTFIPTDEYATETY